MDLELTPVERAFREEVRAFIKSSLPADIRRKIAMEQRWNRSDVERWQKILLARGWAVPNWPVQWGGCDWTPMQRYLFAEEGHRAAAPEVLSFNVNMVGPVIIAFGTEEQKRFFLPRIANLDFWFCQGFSEPGAGSDLASLKTRAVRQGDEYVINGQKIWTSKAQYADWMFCLVRTDPQAARKQEGITYLLIDMKTPGITRRPIITIDGQHHFNEIFFDDVRVPVSNRIGEENMGWRYAKVLLGNERGGQARVGISKRRLDRAKLMARHVPTGQNRTLWDDIRFRQKVSMLEAELKALELTQLRVITRQRSSGVGNVPDPASSILKIKGSELQQATTEIYLEVCGPLGIPFLPDYSAGKAALDHDGLVGPEWAAGAVSNYFFWRELTIAGGTTEIQKNIVAKRVLDLGK